MTRRVLRPALAGALMLAAVMLSTAAVAALTPQPRGASSPFVPLAALTSVPAEGRAIRVTAALDDLDREAMRARKWSYTWMGVSLVNKSAGLPIYITRNGDSIHAFIGVDPRNGCELRYHETRVPSFREPVGVLLHDSCHGSIYDLKGQRVGGPSPWSLDELVITIRNGLVYADATKVIPGRWLAGTR